MLKKLLLTCLALGLLIGLPISAQAKTHKVEFISSHYDENNQRIVYDVQHVDHGQKANPIPTPQRKNNVFLRWSGGYTYDEPITEDRTIVAIWGLDKGDGGSQRPNTPPSTNIEKPAYSQLSIFTIGSESFVQEVNQNREAKTIDVAPYIVDGRTMLPLRFAAESIGYEVSYDNATRSAKFTKDGKTALVYLDSRDFYIGDDKHTFSVDPVIKNDRIMLPVSELATALGLSHGYYVEGKNIEWKQDTKEVYIKI